MKRATLTRITSSDEGTFGELRSEDGFLCKTVELPWRENKPCESCIPEGVYRFRMVNSPKHGFCYEAENVPRRDHIQIHSANWAGDEFKGYKCQLLGCIAPGKTIEPIPIGPGKSQRGVTSSRQTVALLETHFQQQPFELAIICAAGVIPMPSKEPK